MPKKLKKNTNDTLARVIALGFKSLEKKLVEIYRGIAGLIGSLRDEVHERFDRLEQFVLPEYKRRTEKSERKVR